MARIMPQQPNPSENPYGRTGKKVREEVDNYIHVALDAGLLHRLAARRLVHVLVVLPATLQSTRILSRLVRVLC
jgi:hypothetical protein